MKKNKILTIISIVTITIFCFSFNQTIIELDIFNAIKNKKIHIDFSSTGKHSGNCVVVKIKNLTTTKLNIKIPLETIFIPEDTADQTLIVTNINNITLLPSENKLLKINGYCTELKDKCPSYSSKFIISKNKNNKLSELITFFQQYKDLDDYILQQSIWCITDNETVSSVYNGDMKTSTEIREFICSKTKQKNTWYNTVRNPEINVDRSIGNNATEIRGIIDFIASEKMELTSIIKDESGNIVWRYPNKLSFPQGDIAFDFKLKVKGWKNGMYTIIYFNGNKEIYNEKFTI